MIKALFSRSMFALCSAALVAATLVSAATPQRSPLLGTWRADLSHSTFQGRAPYRQGTITFSTAPNGMIRVVSDIVTANGAQFHFEYQSLEDDSVVQVTGNPYYDSASIAWRDRRTAVRTERRAGKVIGATTMVLAEDGRSFKASSSRTTPEDGHLYTSVILWKRVEE